MPIYEYLCTSCQHRYERIVRGPVVEERCPVCGGLAQRTVSVPASGQMSSSTGGGCAPRGGFG